MITTVTRPVKYVPLSREDDVSKSRTWFIVFCLSSTTCKRGLSGGDSSVSRPLLPVNVRVDLLTYTDPKVPVGVNLVFPAGLNLPEVGESEGRGVGHES